ncbi:unnamed protein product [Zymoseptoria tritici ST99CH_3D7]|uniref:Uncharacterized protein n=1 Tax=Zymoseptoria tritici (strain ST99CH_3D7) TaxID=1276538 RepID=A0A1X7S695_ZYMT9|nr:unnamed protein product [Zymoseptoria tritici ST99CH_3D7]
MDLVVLPPEAGAAGLVCVLGVPADGTTPPLTILLLIWSVEIITAIFFFFLLYDWTLTPGIGSRDSPCRTRSFPCLAVWRARRWTRRLSNDAVKSGTRSTYIGLTRFLGLLSVVAVLRISLGVACWRRRIVILLIIALIVVILCTQGLFSLLCLLFWLDRFLVLFPVLLIDRFLDLSAWVSPVPCRSATTLLRTLWVGLLPGCGVCKKSLAIKLDPCVHWTRSFLPLGKTQISKAAQNLNDELASVSNRPKVVVRLGSAGVGSVSDPQGLV